MEKQQIKKEALGMISEKLKVASVFCDDCWVYHNKIKEATHIQEPDPYQEDVNNCKEIKDLCDNCYQESVNDI